MVQFTNVSLAFIGASYFSINLAGKNDGAIYSSGNTVTNNFISNHVKSGDGTVGEIYTLDHVVLTFNRTNNFINNSAGFCDGAIRARKNISMTFNGTNNFVNKSAKVGSGAISILASVVLTFSGTNNFNNSAEIGSSACYQHIG